jgi:hypothetical protein
MKKSKLLPKSWTTVTPVSKAIALMMFALFPVFGFWYGMWVQKTLDAANVPPQRECLPLPRVR